MATLDHPAGPLHIIVGCLEYEPAYNDDRVAQGHRLVELATDPELDGPLPVLIVGDLHAAPAALCCGRCTTCSSTPGLPVTAILRP